MKYQYLNLQRLSKRLLILNQSLSLCHAKKFFKDKYEDISRKVPDVLRIKKIIGWEAKTLLEDGIKETIACHKKRIGI